MKRILGRVALQDVINPLTTDILVHAGQQITESIVKQSSFSSRKVEVRSPLTTGSNKGICAKCYGRNLATGKMTQKVKLLELLQHSLLVKPGTQLTLRTFHVGGVAGGISEDSSIIARFAW